MSRSIALYLIGTGEACLRTGRKCIGQTGCAERALDRDGKCVVYDTHYMRTDLGDYLRNRRMEKQQEEGNAFSLRQLAARIGIEPSYLSKIERGLEPRPSEDTTKALAKELGEDPDMLLAMAG